MAYTVCHAPQIVNEMLHEIHTVEKYDNIKNDLKLSLNTPSYLEPWNSYRLDYILI